LSRSSAIKKYSGITPELDTPAVAGRFWSNGALKARMSVWAAFRGTNIARTKSSIQPRSGTSSTALRYSRGHLPSNMGAQDPALSIGDEVVNGPSIQKSHELRASMSVNQNPNRDDIHDHCIENVIEYVSICMNFWNIN
jgi:hypothetical protein